NRRNACTRGMSPTVCAVRTATLPVHRRRLRRRRYEAARVAKPGDVLRVARGTGSAIMDHCIFCDLIHGAGEVSVCYEDSDAIAFMDVQPVNAGHLLVVPRMHYESLLDIPAELGHRLF